VCGASSSLRAREQEPELNGGRAAMFRIARAFMEKYSVPGMSISISRHGKFVYEHQWGIADTKEAQLVLPTSLFRIASVTKPITSVTIFSLVERSHLNLNDKVF
jgi:CubicO group peptidase (beta-lactamase class C family)